MFRSATKDTRYQLQIHLPLCLSIVTLLLLLLVSWIVHLPSDHLPNLPRYSQLWRALDYDWGVKDRSELPCATWENGALEWAVNASLEWKTVVTDPSYRPCWVFPPFPEKPDTVRMVPHA